MTWFIDIFGNPIIEESTWNEQLEEHYGETIDSLSYEDVYSEVLHENKNSRFKQ